MSKSIFYCDIEGTFNSSPATTNNNLRESELNCFINALDTLCEVTNQEEILFGFISSNPIEVVKEKILEFLPYVKKSKHVSFGTSFGERHKIIGNNIKQKECHTIGKPFQIIKNIEHIKKDNDYEIKTDDISTIYFADDTYMQHILLEEILPKHYKNIKLVCLVPGREIQTNECFGDINYGLYGVIESIFKYAKLQNKEHLQKTNLEQSQINEEFNN